MPNPWLFLIACAGIYAGLKWIGHLMDEQAKAAEHMAEELSRASARKTVPKDMGTLEYDESSKVYRPRKLHS